MSLATYPSSGPSCPHPPSPNQASPSTPEKEKRKAKSDVKASPRYSRTGASTWQYQQDRIQTDAVYGVDGLRKICTKVQNIKKNYKTFLYLIYLDLENGTIQKNYKLSHETCADIFRTLK